MKYRKAILDDKYRLMQLGQESYGEFASVLGDAHWPQMNEFLTNEDAMTELLTSGVTFIAEEDGLLLGMIFILPSGQKTKHFDAAHSHIRYLSVSPKARGKGIARKLTELCIEHAQQTKEQGIALHTSEFMDAARYVYESYGFKKQHEFELFGKRYWVYLLSL